MYILGVCVTYGSYLWKREIRVLLWTSFATPFLFFFSRWHRLHALLEQLVCYNDSTNVTEDTASLLLVGDLEQASWWQQHIGWYEPVFSAVRVTAYDDSWIQHILLFSTAVSFIQCTYLIQPFGSLLDNITCILLFSCFNESRYTMRWNEMLIGGSCPVCFIMD